ncbi:MAG: hypothetical protein FJ290_07420 [Planctomycetes bacterium]|nr:hypothetical protein [Planctomycetota bacterium]
MVESKDYRGTWFLPQHPSHSVHGTLEVGHDSDLTLSLDDSLSTRPDLFAGDRYEVILGRAVTGEEITLCGCLETGRTIVSRATGDQQTIHASLGFIGAHFETEDNIRFKEVLVRPAFLDEWLGISGFRIQHDFDARKVTVEYSHPPAVPIGDVEDLRCSFRFTSHGPTQTIVQKDASVSQEAWLCLESLDREAAFGKLWELASNIKMLLALAVKQPVYDLVVVGRSDIATFRTPTDPGVTHHEDIQVLMSQDRPGEPLKRVIPHEMLFTWHDLAADPAGFLARWLATCRRFMQTLNCLSAVRYRPDAYLDQRFLTLVHGLGEAGTQS